MILMLTTFGNLPKNQELGTLHRIIAFVLRQLVAFWMAAF